MIGLVNQAFVNMQTHTEEFADICVTGRWLPLIIDSQRSAQTKAGRSTVRRALLTC